VELVASLSQGRTAAAQCGLFTYKSVPVIFEPPCICSVNVYYFSDQYNMFLYSFIDHIRYDMFRPVVAAMSVPG